MKKVIVAMVALATLASCQPDKRPNVGRMLGLEGKNGTDGAAGSAGANGSNGAAGSQGPAGQTGATGPQGIAGSSKGGKLTCTVTQLSDGASIQCPDGSSAIITNGRNAN